jgi:hypothetical protein
MDPLDSSTFVSRTGSAENGPIDVEGHDVRHAGVHELR